MTWTRIVFFFSLLASELQAIHFNSQLNTRHAVLQCMSIGTPTLGGRANITSRFVHYRLCTYYTHCLRPTRAKGNISPRTTCITRSDNALSLSLLCKFSLLSATTSNMHTWSNFMCNPLLSYLVSRHTGEDKIKDRWQ